MHIGAILVITLIVLVCLGPGAILRALAGLGCLLVIAAIVLGLLWIFFHGEGTPPRESASQSEILRQ